MRLRRSAPMFPPPVWNVHEETLADGDRTNNLSTDDVGRERAPLFTVFRSFTCPPPALCLVCLCFNLADVAVGGQTDRRERHNFLITPFLLPIPAIKSKLCHTHTGYRRSAHLPFSSPFLPLLSVTHSQCDARPTVTFPAERHHCPLAGTKLYCLVTEAHVC